MVRKAGGGKRTTDGKQQENVNSWGYQSLHNLQSKAARLSERSARKKGHLFVSSAQTQASGVC